MITQLPLLPITESISRKSEAAYRDKLMQLVASNLDFPQKDSASLSHNFHSFPAKFPHQLPRKFIVTLTEPGDLVLDPMMGSGTTILESYFAGRRALGFDIDPLALRIAYVKTTAIDLKELNNTMNRILDDARKTLRKRNDLKRKLNEWKETDAHTSAFIDDWFDPETQLELFALRNEIFSIDDVRIRSFAEVAYSAIIITKSGGVSLALDLAHTRPHKAKVVIDRNGKKIFGNRLSHKTTRNLSVLTKRLKSPIEEFEKRFGQNIAALQSSQTYDAGTSKDIVHKVVSGSAQFLPLASSTVDLIVTSPPYASNAIDYMRAHKFSLLWLGHPLDSLSQKRKEYLGGERLSEMTLVEMPLLASRIVAKLGSLDLKKSRVLWRYYSEMACVLTEMYRVLKPGKAAIMVVGSSQMRGVDTRTQYCLADIGKSIGFDVPIIGSRQLDRNRRMLPAGLKVDLRSQIQQRMHQEFVIAFYKPPH